MGAKGVSQRAKEEVAKDRERVNSGRSQAKSERARVEAPGNEAAHPRDGGAEVRRRFAEVMRARAERTLDGRRDVLQRKLARCHEDALWSLSEGWPVPRAASEALQSSWLQSMLVDAEEHELHTLNGGDAHPTESERGSELSDLTTGCDEEHNGDAIRFSAEEFESFLERNQEQG